jgi:hypothetical protein
MPTAGVNDKEEVGLWYNQAQSVTRYLMRDFSQAQFVQMCDELRGGRSLAQSLRTAYGLSIPDEKTLERLWRENLTERSLDSIR